MAGTSGSAGERLRLVTASAPDVASRMVYPSGAALAT
ncbi:Uncharacterised protein [Bordetella pertussis]|nr:Uncharacterised protein [Bordetella pertussis]